MKSREDIMKGIFARHPQTDKFYVTSDHQAFSQEGDANTHAKSLKDDSVDVEKREKYFPKKVEDKKTEVPAKTETQAKTKAPAKTSKPASTGKGKAATTTKPTQSEGATTEGGEK